MCAGTNADLRTTDRGTQADRSAQANECAHRCAHYGTDCRSNDRAHRRTHQGSNHRSDDCTHGGPNHRSHRGADQSAHLGAGYIGGVDHGTYYCICGIYNGTHGRRNQSGRVRSGDSASNQGDADSARDCTQVGG